MDVILYEVGLREGLQSESSIVPLKNKIGYVAILCQAGIQNIQLGSFVHPKKIPQMADSDDLCSHVLANYKGNFSALVLNEKGLDRAIQTGIKQVDLSMSVSDSHSLNNTGMSCNTAKASMRSLVHRAHQAGMRVRMGLQCAFGCVEEGTIDCQHIIDLAKFFLDTGIDILSLADSTGMANPRSIRNICSEAIKICGSIPLVLHLHNTTGLGMVNLYEALSLGIRHFDTSFGGLGGCPYIKGAAGNLATEDVVYFLDKTGYTTGVDRRKISSLTNQLSELLEHSMPGYIYKIQNSPTFSA